MQNHNSKVNQLSNQIKIASKSNHRLRIYHGQSHTTRELPKDTPFLDISDLKEILEINSEEDYALVEPNVTMEKLVTETLKKNLIPLVVTEFPKITIGGAVQGGAGESSSFKYGLVHSTCDEYEIILGNGEVVMTSVNIRPELFSAIPCSYGSLGVLTKAKIKLINAKSTVELSYIPVKNFSELLEIIQTKNKTNIDFLDAIMFSKTCGVVMIGRMVDESIQQTETTFSKSTDDWFYIHAYKKIQTSQLTPDFISLAEYLFRYDQGAFWSGKLLFDYLRLPVNNFTKRILHRYLNAKMFYKALHTSNKSQYGIVQDFCVPINNVTNFLDYLDQKLNRYPIWICPIKGSQIDDRLSPHHLNVDNVINIGLYAHWDDKFENYIKVNRDLETALKNFHGRKVLYAHQYYTPEQFWKIYDHSWYSKLRAMYYTDIFPDIYEKTNVGKKYETRFFTTLLKFLASTMRLNKKNHEA